MCVFKLTKIDMLQTSDHPSEILLKRGAPLTRHEVIEKDGSVKRFISIDPGFRCSRHDAFCEEGIPVYYKFEKVRK